MNKKYFTADLHLAHSNIIKYCHRSFVTADEMDAVILNNLEDTVPKGSVLYVLGDLTFSINSANVFFDITDRLHIQVHYIRGNHDRRAMPVIEERSVKVNDIEEIKIQGQDTTLCHYAMRVWNKSHYNAFQLYGHSHGTLDPVGKQWDVGVDNNDFKPLLEDEVISIMEQRPDNVNFLGNKE